MIPGDIQKIVEVMELLERFELAVSECYGACAESWEEERQFWEDLSRAEIQHAGTIRKMSEILQSKPERFQSE